MDDDKDDIGRTNADDDAELLREELTRSIDTQLAQLDQAILELENHARAHELDVSDTLAPLKSSSTSLAILRAMAGTADRATLAGISAAVAPTIAAVQREIADTRAQTGYQSGAMLHEMQESAVTALEMKLSAEAADFRRYEESNRDRIEDLAATNGVDLSSYRAIRKDLLTDRALAMAKGDRAGQYKADYLLAVNSRVAGERVGMTPEEIARARAEEEAALQRYLLQSEIAAKREAEKLGLAGDAAKDHIAAARAAAEAEAREAARKLAEQAQHAQAETGVGPKAVAQTDTAAFLDDRAIVKGERGGGFDAGLASSAVGTDEAAKKSVSLSREGNLWGESDLPQLPVTEASAADQFAPSSSPAITAARAKAVPVPANGDEATPILAVAEADNDEKQPAIGGKTVAGAVALG